MKRIVRSAILIFLFFFQVLHSRTENHILNYQDFYSYYNPAFTGSGRDFRMTALYQLPKERIFPYGDFYIINAEINLSTGRCAHGIGISTKQFDSALYKDNLYSIKYSYCFPVFYGRLAFGLQPGLTSSSDSLRTHKFDLNMGVLYSLQRFYIGIGCVQITRGGTKSGNESPKKYLKRTYNLLAGHNISLKNPLYKIEPSLFLRTDLNRVEADITAKLIYKQKYAGGLSWNINRSVGIRAGMTIRHICFGYGWDHPLASSFDVRNSIHEFFAAYSFPMKVKKQEKYKRMSIRIL